MGHCLSRLPNFGWCGHKDIISDDSLEAIRELVATLRTSNSDIQTVGPGWIFRAGAAVHHGVVQEILKAIQKGQARTIRSMLEAGWRLEAAQALYVFLTKLHEPLVPDSIQSLVLDNSDNIPVEVIATDVLGLMKQELPQKHLQLISIVLNLLDTYIKSSPSDELRGNTLPITMLPLFFNIQNQHVDEWRRIVTIFVELIRQASCHLQTSTQPQTSRNVHLIDEDPILMNDINQYLQQPIEVGENVVLRRFLQPVDGHRGDCNSFAAYRIRRNISEN